MSITLVRLGLLNRQLWMLFYSLSSATHAHLIYWTPLISINFSIMLFQQCMWFFVARVTLKFAFSASQLEKNSLLKIDDLIPKGYQISRSIHEKYTACFNEKAGPLIKIANRNGFSITADFAQNGANYLAITIHLIDDSW
jgi:hypothetical protein